MQFWPEVVSFPQEAIEYVCCFGMSSRCDVWHRSFGGHLVKEPVFIPLAVRAVSSLKHKPRNLWNVLSPPALMKRYSCVHILLRSVKIYPEQHTRAHPGRLPPLNQAMVISVLNTLCACVGRRACTAELNVYDMWMSAYLWFIHVHTQALRAKGIFAVAIPGHDRKSVSQPTKKKKKRKKGKPIALFTYYLLVWET